MRTIDFPLTSISSVVSKTADGKEITIKAIPSYDRKDTVGASTKAFMGINVSVGSTNSGQSDVVEGTLKCY